MRNPFREKHGSRNPSEEEARILSVSGLRAVHRGEDEVLGEFLLEFDLLTAAHLRKDHLDRQPGVIQTSDRCLSG